MPVARDYFCAIDYSSKIYTFGGWDGMLWANIRDALTLVDEYTPDDLQFSVYTQDKLSSTWGSIKSIK
jgi:hypothetical protein